MNGEEDQEFLIREQVRLKMEAKIQAELEKIKIQEEEKRQKSEMERAQKEELRRLEYEELKREADARQKELKLKEEAEEERQRIEYLKMQEDLEKQIEEARKISVQENIKLELKRLAEQEEAWKQKVAEEERLKRERQKKKEEMKLKIAEEIERIKKLEEEQALKKKALEHEQQQSEAKLNQPQQESSPKIEPPQPMSIQSKCMLETLRLEKEKEELRIKSEEARKAAERREFARKEAERLKKEAEMARKKAIEEETRRLLEQEEAERHAKLEAERQKRIEEERQIAEKILKRKMEDEEIERKAREEAEAQKLRDQEEVRQLMKENMRRKLMVAEEKQKHDELLMDVKPKRKALADNPLLKRFEEISKASQETKGKSMPNTSKRKVWKKKSVEVLRMSRLMLTQALSKEKLASPEGKKLVQAVSKEILRIVSRESLGTKKSNCSLRKSKSRLDIARSKSQLSKENVMSPQNQLTAMNVQPSKKDMQNYLISHVLFDGAEDVQAQGNRNKSKQQLTAANEEEEMEDRMFELYKKEMEKYLDFIGQDHDKKSQKKGLNKKKNVEETGPEKKILINVGSIKNQFETLASPEVQQAQEVSAPISARKVGKLNTKELFADQEREQQEEQLKRRKKKEYIPVIIDRDAFERTVGKFAKAKDEDESTHSIKREVKAWKNPVLKMAETIKDDEISDNETEPSDYHKTCQCVTHGDSKSEPETEHEPEPEIEPEPELTEEEKVKKMDIVTRIQYELDKIKKEEEEHKKKIERENKKRELAKQIQEQIERIKALDKAPEKKEDDDVPTWVKLVKDPEARKKYKMKQSNEEEPLTMKEQDCDEKETEVDDTPQWIKMIKERQAQLRKFEIEFNQKKIEEKKQNYEQATPVPQHKNTMAKEGTGLKTSTSAKNQGDIMDTMFTSSKGASPYEINPERVKMIKEQLLKSREKPMQLAKKEESFLAKKCSFIRNKFEQAFSGPSNEEKKLSSKKMKKIIKVAEEPSIEQLIQEKKTKNLEKSWSYKQKDLKDLYLLMETNEQLSKGFKDKAKIVEEHSSEIESKTEELVSLQEQIESMEIKEYSDLMDRVHGYLSTSQSLTPEEQAFRSTIEGYLALIEDGKSDKAHKKKTVKASTSSGLPGRSLQSIKQDIEKTLEDCSKAKDGSDLKIKKLDLTQFEQTSENSKEKQILRASKELCSSIKDQLVKASIPAVPESRMHHKIKFVHIDQPKSSEESLKELKAQRINEWKWKQKSIAELQQFLMKNKEAVKIPIPDKLNDFTSTTSPTENIHYDAQLDDYMKLMDSIKDYFLNDQEMSAEKNAFKETLCSYLDLIEDDDKTVKDEKGYLKFDWSQPKVKDISKQLNSCDDGPATTFKPNDVVGKLNIGRYENIEEDQLRKPIPVVKTSSYYCDAIKSQLQKSAESRIEHPQDLSIKRTMKIVNIAVPESSEEALRQMKQKRQEEWKWKQKAISDFHQFLQTSEHGSKIVQQESIQSNLTDIMSLKEKSDQLAKSIRQRDNAMKAFMDDLQNFSDKPSDNTDEVIFKEGIKAFLDLIDDESTSKPIGELPDIMSPNKVKAKKEQYLEGLKESGKCSQGTFKKIGKLDTTNLILKKASVNEEKQSSSKLINVDKASIIKKMFESSKGSSMSRTMSELNLMPKVRRPKSIIEVNPKQHAVQIDLSLKRRPTLMRQISAPTYPAQMPQERKEEKVRYNGLPRGKWDSIQDPEERKKAILAKHGFKVHKPKPSPDNDPMTDIDTIPNHILKDEILYKRYMLENVKIESDSSRDSSPERKRDPKEGSFSSLMNILSAVKKATMQKHAIESRQMLDKLAQKASAPRLSTSAQDLTLVPGSCQNIKQLFDKNDKQGASSPILQRVTKSQSISNIGALWLDQMKLDNEGQCNGADASFIKSGIVSNLRNHLSNRENEPSMQDTIRKSLSHLELDDTLEHSSSRSDVRLELEALRSSRQSNSIFKLEKGNKPSLRRAQSYVEMSESKDNHDLDDEVLAEVRANKEQVRAMFEASAPKYKFGGSGESLNKQILPERKGPVMRPSQKAKEERKWVLDTINKYFDVIVEEEDNGEIEEETDEEDEDEIVSISSAFASEDEPNESDFEQDQGNNFKSTSKIRSLLTRAVTNVSSSQSNLASLSKLKQNLGSRISLGLKHSVENLSSL